jgi:hypothetical protein
MTRRKIKVGDRIRFRAVTRWTDKPATRKVLDFDLEGRPLDRIVQQRGDRLILVRPVFEHNRRNSEEVGDIGYPRSLALLLAVEAAGIGERIVEALGEEGGIGHRDPPVGNPNSDCARQRGCGRDLRRCVAGF